VLLNPVFRFFEGLAKADERSGALVWRCTIRVIVIGVCYFVAIAIPFFGAILNLMGMNEIQCCRNCDPDLIKNSKAPFNALPAVWLVALLLCTRRFNLSRTKPMMIQNELDIHNVFHRRNNNHPILVYVPLLVLSGCVLAQV
jgi:hypothetical protein